MVFVGGDGDGEYVTICGMDLTRLPGCLFFDEWLGRFGHADIDCWCGTW